MKTVLVSACLFGVCCRYDGKEKANEKITALLERKDLCLIPVCPEQMGGLQTPRLPCERQGDRVVNSMEEDMTKYFENGARQVLKIARLYHCDLAILKERSPSCGAGQIYDGTFTGTLTKGDGMTAQLLQDHGIQVIGESAVVSAPVFERRIQE